MCNTVTTLTWSRKAALAQFGREEGIVTAGEDQNSDRRWAFGKDSGANRLSEWQELGGIAVVNRTEDVLSNV